MATWYDEHDLNAIFLEATELPSGEERARYLDRACDGKAELRARVEELLSAHDGAGDFMADTPDMKPGTRVGPYKLLQVIGEGGMGTVYMADQTEPVERRVALKIIKLGMDSGEIIARFEAERQALAMMDHPNIAKVFDAGTTGTGRPYFAMELVKGVPITEYCDEHKLDTRQRLELFIPVCRAVHHAHQKGVIHRDLKPANVLIAHYDDEPVPKVIDFGVAKATSGRLTQRTMFTQFGQIVGTLEYMSPEQAKFNQLDIDTRSDIYSLGVLLYELLTGTTPFERGRLQVAGVEEILRIIREEEPPKPSTRVSALGDPATAASLGGDPTQLRRRLQGDLDWIVMHAMDKERSRRYESAAAFVEDIERFLNDEAVHACPPSKAYRMRKFVRRHRGPVVAAATVLVMLVLGLIGTSLGYLEANEAEQRALRSRDAERRMNFRMAMERGLALCEEGHVGHGMLWLARSLELCPPDAPEKERVVRTNLNAWRRELHTIEAMFAHEASVISVAISPDGKRIVTGSDDDTAQIWDLGTGQPIGRPLPHKSDVHELAWSADGSLLLGADYRATAFLWDSRSGRRIHTFDHAEGASPREVVRKVMTGGVVGAAFRPPAYRQVVTSCGDGTVAIWDVETGAQTGRLPELKHMVHDVAVSPDGKWILTGCHDGTARIWDFETLEPVATFDHNAERVTTVSFRNEANQIVTGDAAGNVFVWSVAAALAAEKTTLMVTTAEYAAVLRRHTGVVHRLRVGPNGDILTASIDNTALLWNPERGSVARAPFEHQGAVQGVAFAPDGKRIAIACDDDVARLWRPARGASVRIVKHDDLEFDQEVVYSADGRYVLVKTKAGAAIVRDAVTREPLCTVEHPGGIRALAVSADRSMIMTGGAKGESRLFLTATGELAHPPFRHAGGVMSVAFCSDGTYTVAGGFGGSVQLRDARTGDLLQSALVGARVWGVAMAPDGARFAGASGDKLARIYSVEEADEPLRLSGHLSSVSAAAFSRNGRRLVTGSHDNTVRVWDTRTGRQVSEPMRHRGPVWYSFCVAFSPDGNAVVTACDDGNVRVWDVATSQPIGPALWHDEGIRMATFTSDTQVRSGTAQGTVRTWDLERSPIEGDAERITFWLQVITGSELGPEGALRGLGSARWKSRRAALRKLGGAPTGS